MNTSITIQSSTPFENYFEKNSNIYFRTDIDQVSAVVTATAPVSVSFEEEITFQFSAIIFCCL